MSIKNRCPAYRQEQLAKKIAALFVVDINDLEPYAELVRNKIAESLPLLGSDSQVAEKSRVVLLEQAVAVVRPCERCAPLVAEILKEEP